MTPLVEEFHQKLMLLSGMKLDLTINNNRSLMLNLPERNKHWARVSIHQMFLNAPEPVLQALARYVRGEGSVVRKILQKYIHLNTQRIDYSHLVDHSRLCSSGEVYDLQKIYNEVNHEYFAGQLNLAITWFGKPERLNRTRVTFGQYHDMLKLIKIHRLMDKTHFPDYFVSFVVYHEMLHHIFPSRVDERGKCRMHTKEFKAKEREFRHYQMAIDWERSNAEHFFVKKRKTG